jgi:hypothetical protein
VDLALRELLAGEEEVAITVDAGRCPRLSRMAPKTIPTGAPAMIRFGEMAKTMGGKNPHAVALANARAASLTPEQRAEIARNAGKVGGVARSKAMTKLQRSESARLAAAARWKNAKKIQNSGNRG